MNCSTVLPETSQLYSGDEPGAIPLLIVTTCCVCVVLGIYLEQIIFICKMSDIWRRRIVTVWLLGIFPVFAFFAWVAVVVPRVSHVSDFVISVYFSACLYHFLHMMLNYLGGEKGFCEVLQHTAVPLRGPPCCCLCVCLPSPPLTRLAANSRTNMGASASSAKAASSNCSLGLPTTMELVHGTAKYGYIAFGIASICVFLTLVIFMFQVVRIFKDTDHWRRRVFTMWLLGIYPFYGFFAWIAVIVPRVSYDVDFVISLYASVCLLLFLKLMLHYVGGEKALCKQFPEWIVPIRSLPCGCCLRCFPEPLLSRPVLLRVRLLVVQTVVVRPSVAFILIIVLANGGEMSNTQQLAGQNPALWLQLVGTLSMLVAVYGLIIVLRMLRQHLHAHSLVAKFMLIKIALLLSHSQQFFFSILSSIHALPCTPLLPSQGRAEAINHLVITLEMLVLSIIGLFVFRPSSDNGEPSADGPQWGHLERNESSQSELAGDGKRPPSTVASVDGLYVTTQP